MRLSLRPTICSLPVLLTVAAGCGDGTPPPPPQVDCSKVVACGGRLEGTWAVRGVCTIENACAGASHDFSGVTTTLTFSVNKVTVSGGGTAKDTVALSCWDGGTGADRCTGLNSMGGYTCSVSGDSCSCSVDYTRINQGIGTMGFVLSGSQVLIGTATYDYCVTNNVLRLAQDLPGGVTGPVSEYVKQ